VKYQVHLAHQSALDFNKSVEEPTWLKFRFLALRMGHLMFNAKSLKALAIFRPNAILIAVLIALYILFCASLIAPF
jgi:hypothetical protein